MVTSFLNRNGFDSKAHGNLLIASLSKAGLSTLRHNTAELKALQFRGTALQCIKKYGVGSCGPRGFYGTVGK